MTAPPIFTPISLMWKPAKRQPTLLPAKVVCDFVPRGPDGVDKGLSHPPGDLDGALRRMTTHSRQEQQGEGGRFRL